MLKKIGGLVVAVALIALVLPQATAAFPLLQTGPYTTVVTFTAITPNPAYVEQLVNLTVQVTAEDPTAGIPSGVVRIESGSTLLCTLPLDPAGQATCTQSWLAAGEVPLKAVYMGSSPFLPAVSEDEYLTIQSKIIPVVEIQSHIPNPSILNRLVDVSVSVGPASPVPGGSVTVFRASSATCLATERLTAVDSCTGMLDGSGGMSCSLALTSVGDVNLCGYYEGDVAHVEGVSAPAIHRVSLSNTFTTITSTDPNPSLLGQSVMVHFSVTSPDGSPSGDVMVTSGSQSCTATVAVGQCALVFNTPHIQTIVAGYAGGTDGAVTLDPSVSDPYQHRVNVPPTDISLSDNTVDAYRSAGLYVGSFSTTDANVDETHVYTLVSGAGSEDNSRFSIADTGLFTADGFTPGEGLSIRIRATDPAGLTYEEVFNLSVNGEVLLPNTGFPAGRVTAVRHGGSQTAVHASTGVELEIPRLNLRTEIVGVPRADDSWDTDWLAKQAGWLEGTAFPTWEGNSVLVAHNYLRSGLPGPFAELDQLRAGDRLLVYVYGQVVVYEVQSVQRIDPQDASVLEHSNDSTLTLLTCASYDEEAGEYRFRVAVQAILAEH
ncbi:MAG: sortase [Anaerolineaceae bacterium]|nr:sortase [Anaerolineaceae bacterium]